MNDMTEMLDLSMHDLLLAPSPEYVAQRDAFEAWAKTEGLDPTLFVDAPDDRPVHHGANPLVGRRWASEATTWAYRAWCAGQAHSNTPTSR